MLVAKVISSSLFDWLSHLNETRGIERSRPPSFSATRDRVLRFQASKSISEINAAPRFFGLNPFDFIGTDTKKYRSCIFTVCMAVMEQSILARTVSCVNTFFFSAKKFNFKNASEKRNTCRMRRRNITCRKNNITSPPVPIVRDVRDSIFSRRLSRTCVIRRYICRRGCVRACVGWGVCRRWKVIPRETRKVV